MEELLFCRTEGLPHFLWEKPSDYGWEWKKRKNLISIRSRVSWVIVCRSLEAGVTVDYSRVEWEELTQPDCPFVHITQFRCNLAVLSEWKWVITTTCLFHVLLECLKTRLSSDRTSSVTPDLQKAQPNLSLHFEVTLFLLRFQFFSSMWPGSDLWRNLRRKINFKYFLSVAVCAVFDCN